MTYIVKSGDTISGIAKAYKISVADLKKVNPTITDVNKIYTGQKITIPNTTTATTTNIKTAINTCLKDIEKLDSYKKLVSLIE